MHAAAGDSVSQSFEDFIGQRVTVVYQDRLGIENVTGMLKSVDEETLGIETFNGINLIGRRAVIRLKPARPAGRLDTPFPSGGGSR